LTSSYYLQTRPSCETVLGGRISLHVTGDGHLIRYARAHLKVSKRKTRTTVVSKWALAACRHAIARPVTCITIWWF